MRFFLLTLLFFASCNAPRANLETGRVTPKGKFTVGADMRGNIPTETVSALYDGLKSAVDDAYDVATGNGTKWTGETGRQNLAKLVDALVIFSMDPLAWGFDFRARYGFYDNFDLGIKYDSGAWAGDIRFQFMGPTNTKNGRGSLIDYGPRWYGSIGVQYSSIDYKMPISYLEKLQDLLGYEFTRKDILIPVAFSYSLGPNETFGAISFGMVYNLGMIKYGFKEDMIADLFERSLEEEGITVPSEDRSIHAFGGFLNIKLGYRWVYAIASLSVYYQNYGKYNIFGIHTKQFSGLTFIPTLGLMGTF